jgi:leishmanolysin-like peptidase
MTSTVQHELLHAPGFSSSLFAFYRDKEGEPMTPRGEDGKPPVNEELQVRQWSDRIVKTVSDWLLANNHSCHQLLLAGD